MRKQLEGIQQEFIHYLQSEELLSGGLLGQQEFSTFGLKSYLRNFREAVRSALSKQYPGVWQLVGEECARALSYSYCKSGKAFGSTGSIEFCTMNFPPYLQQVNAQHQLPYLSDYAQFELICDQLKAGKSVPRVAPPTALTEETLSEPITGARYIRVFASPYNIYDIWRMLNNAIDVVENITAQCYMLLYRTNQGLVIEQISSLEHELFKALGRGQPLGEAMSQFSEDEAEALACALSKLFAIVFYI